MISAGRRLLLWDIDTGTIVHELGKFEAPLSCCCLSLDGKTLAAAGPAALPGLYDVGAADGRSLIRVSPPSLLRLFDLDKLRLLKTIRCTGDIVEGCALGEGSRVAVVASHDFRPRPWKDAEVEPSLPCRHRLEVWDIQGSRLMRTFGGLAEVLSASFTPDLTKVVTILHRQAPRVWDRSTGRSLATLAGGEGYALSCAISADGREVVTGTSTGAVHLWDAVTGQLLRTFRGEKGRIRACTISPDKGEILSASDEQTMALWDRGSGRLLRSLNGHDAAITTCTFSPDGREILSGAVDGQLRVWHGDGRLLRSLKRHRAPISALAYSPSARYFVSGTESLGAIEIKSGELFAWNGSDVLKGMTLPNETHKVPGGELFFTERIRAVSFYPQESPDFFDIPMDLHAVKNPWILSGSEADGNLEVPFAPEDRSGALRLWDPNNRRVVRRFPGHCAPVVSCAFTPDGLRAVSLCTDGTLREFPLDDLMQKGKGRATTPRFGRGFADLFPGFEKNPEEAVRQAARAIARDGAPWRPGLSNSDLPVLEEVRKALPAKETAATLREQEQRGLDLLLGRGGPAAPRTGRSWLRAAAVGSPTATARLAWALERGLGATPARAGYIELGRRAEDLREAARLRASQPVREPLTPGDLLTETLSAAKSGDVKQLLRASERGEPDALLALAKLEPTKADEYLGRGAKLGDPQAMFRLGQATLRRDRDAARKHFESAAFLGEPDAILALAELIEGEGRGTEQAEGLRKAVKAFRAGDPEPTKTKDDDLFRVLDFNPPAGWTKESGQEEKGGKFVNGRETPTLELASQRRTDPRATSREEFDAWFRDEGRHELFQELLRGKAFTFKGLPAWQVITRRKDGILVLRLLAITQRFRYVVTCQVPDLDTLAFQHARFMLLIYNRLNLGHADDLLSTTADAPTRKTARRVKTQAELDSFFKKILAADESVADLLDRARRFAQRNDWDEVMYLCQRVLRAHPRHAKALRLQGEAHLARREYDEALKDYYRLLSLKPMDTAALCGRANAYLGRGDLKWALDDFDKALALAPTLTNAHQGRGDVLSSQGKLDEAIAAYSRTLAHNKDHQGALYERGWTYLKQKRYDEAIGDYTRLLELNYRYAAAYAERGDAYREKGVADRAIADYDSAIEIDAISARAYAGRGLVRVDRKEYEKALIDLDLAAELQPNQPDHLYQLARCHALAAASSGTDSSGRKAKRHHFDQAIQDLSRLREKGFRDWKRVKDDVAFTPLREEKEFQKLIQP